MKKRWFLVGVMLLLASLLVAGCGVPQEDYDAVLAERDAVQAEVASLQSELTGVRSELAGVRSDLTEAEELLLIEQGKYTASQREVLSLQLQISSLQSDLAKAKAQIAELEVQITAWEHGYTLRDPTYKEVITFLRQDKTDENEYVEDTYGVYVCSHFARDACNNAEEAGLRCAFVELRYLDGGHAIIAFNTIDEGLVYFDAITDERVRPVVGKRYYQCIEPEAGHYYEEPPHDDTIMDILVIW